MYNSPVKTPCYSKRINNKNINTPLGVLDNNVEHCNDPIASLDTKSLSFKNISDEKTGLDENFNLIDDYTELNKDLSIDSSSFNHDSDQDSKLKDNDDHIKNPYILSKNKPMYQDSVLAMIMPKPGDIDSISTEIIKSNEKKTPTINVISLNTPLKTPKSRLIRSSILKTPAINEYGNGQLTPLTASRTKVSPNKSNNTKRGMNSQIYTPNPTPIVNKIDSELISNDLSVKNKSSYEKSFDLIESNTTTKSKENIRTLMAKAFDRFILSDRKNDEIINISEDNKENINYEDDSINKEKEIEGNYNDLLSSLKRGRSNTEESGSSSSKNSSKINEIDNIIDNDIELKSTLIKEFNDILGIKSNQETISNKNIVNIFKSKFNSLINEIKILKEENEIYEQICEELNNKDIELLELQKTSNILIKENEKFKTELEDKDIIIHQLKNVLNETC